jgi:hypothetical protein
MIMMSIQIDAPVNVRGNLHLDLEITRSDGSAETRGEFKERLTSEAQRLAGDQSEINFDFPMRLFKATKA